MTHNHPRRRTVNGRRGAFLIAFGVAYGGLGYSYAFVEPTAGRAAALAYITNHLSIHWLGIPWLVVAVVALGSAFVREPSDRFGYSGLSFLPVIWGGLYVIAWRLGDSPGGWVSGILYAAIAAAPLIVSGMVNPPSRGQKAQARGHK